MSNRVDEGAPRGMPSRPVRIANCSGFYGDRQSALEEMVSGGPVDVVTGDYLAEVTMLVLARSRLKNPDAGYATSFLKQLRPVASDIAGRGIKVVVNAGGLNPAGLARATSAMLNELEVDLAVAYVDGDDISARIGDLLDSGISFENLDTGAPFSDWGHEPLTANAYLGGFGIKAALDAGADIVVTGRVAESVARQRFRRVVVGVGTAGSPCTGWSGGGRPCDRVRRAGDGRKLLGVSRSGI